MAVYITGDTHADFSRFHPMFMRDWDDLTKDDVVIICGDFGGVWYSKDYDEDAWKRQEKKLDDLQNLPFTIAFVDGNHSNFTELAKYPISVWNGARVHKIRPNVIHIMRGEILTLEDHTFWCFGGASSHDIRDGIIDSADPNWEETAYIWYKRGCQYRIKGLSWWEEELPSKEEMMHGLETLQDYDYNVDYIITHSPPGSVIALIGHGMYDHDVLTSYLDDVRAMTEYRRHYMGHMHEDWAINDKDILIYENIERVM